jgi:PAS domain S-box-containing protein
MDKEFLILVENTPEAIFIQVNGKFAYINPAGVKLFGATSEKDLIGHEIIEWIDSQCHDKVRERINVLNHDKLPVGILEQIYRRMDGRKILVEVSATPFVFQGENGALAFVRDITERKESEQRYLDLFSKMPDGFLVCEVICGSHMIPQDLKILQVNEAATSIIELSKTEIENRPLSALYPKFSESMTMYRGKLVEVLNGRNLIQEIPFVYTNKKKIIKIHAYSCAPNQVAFILEDVTQIRYNEGALKIAKEKAEESDRLKANILSMLNHEIRTPMNSILGFSNLISSVAPDDDLRNMAKRINISGYRLLSTLDDLIDLSTIEAEFNSMKPELVNVYEEIVGLYPTYKPICQQKNLTFTFTSIDEPQIFVPRSLYIKTLQYIIDNAIKFTEEGGIHIDIRITKDMTGEWADVTVKDTGIGIESHNLQKIFEVFNQVSTGYGRKYEGLGIGLTSAKKMANLLKGTILVNSSFGEGSEFILRMPLHVINYERLNEEKTPIIIQARSNIKSSKKSFSKHPKFLLIEDNEDNAEYLRTALAVFGTSDIAQTGELALALIKKGKYDVIFLDIGLGPNMDGLITVRQIRAVKGYEDVPIIATTGYTSENDIKCILDGGCDYYIGKPFSIESITEFVKNKLL